MTDDLNAILHGAPETPSEPFSQTAPVTSGAGQDELMTALHGPEGAAAIDPQTQRFLQGTPEQGNLELFGTGAQRGVQSFKSSLPAWQGIIADLQGDPILAKQKMLESKAIEDNAPPAQWELKNVSDPYEFMHWLSEKAGENAINLAGAIPVGGTGAFVGQLAAKGLARAGLETALNVAGKSTSAAEIGAGLGLYGYTFGIETPQTAQEQFQVTGSPQAGRSIAAGAVKGLLEMYTPLSISRALLAPGMQLGKTYTGAVAKTFAKEAGTEAAQEAVDIYARQLADPSYSYFTNGFTLNPAGFGEGAWRFAEAGIAGGFLGAAVGAPAHYFEKKAEVRRATGGAEPYGETVLPPLPEGVLPQEAIAKDKVDVLKEGNHWTAESPYGQVFAVIDRLPDGRRALRVQSSGLNQEQDKGAGHGAALYKTLFDEALKSGYVVHSDGIVSEEAAKVYDAFRKHGYTVEGPAGRVHEDAAGKFYSNASSFESRTPVFQVTEGPVTALRRMVVQPQEKLQQQQLTNRDVLPQEAIAHSSRDDIMDLSPLISETFREPQAEHFLDLLEAHTPRFVEVPKPGQKETRVWTDTELEQEFAQNRPQGEAPQFLRIDQDQLQPAGMTAHELDLPPVNSNRIFFIKGVTPEQRVQMLAQYGQLAQQAQIAQRVSLADATSKRAAIAMIKPLYNELLTGGLRVVPSRGAGFHYNAVLDGAPVKNLAETKRSTHIAIYDLETNKITPFSDTEMQAKIHADEGGFLDSGIVVSVDENKLVESDIVKNADGTYSLTKALGIEKLVPGIKIMSISALESQPVGFIRKEGESKIMVLDVKNPQSGDRVQKMAEQILPALVKQLEDAGIQQGLGIYITDNRPPIGGVATRSPAWAFVDTGVIGLSPEMLDQWELSTGDLRIDLLQAVQHELGHIITYWHWRNLPSEIQQQLIYAWNKSRLALRGGDPSKVQSAFAQAPDEFVQYWATFPEWLAEQYRRYATSDPRIVNWLDQAMAGGGKKLERFHASWERQFGKQSALNISQPDYYFSGFMQYIREFGDERKSFTQLMRQEALYSAPQGLSDTPMKLQAMSVITAAIKSMQHMHPPEVALALNEWLDPHIIPGQTLESSAEAAGRYIPTDAGLIELAVGVLAREDNPYGATQMYYGHELWHGMEEKGFVGEKQIAVLMRDIKGNEHKLFDTNHQRGLYKRVKEYGQARGFSQQWVEEKFKSMRDKEFRAYYMQEFIRTGKAWSQEAQSIFAYIIATLERIANAMRGLGYQTAEDVRRAFFKGEMVARAENRQANAERVSWSASHYALPQEAISQRTRHSIQPSHTWQIGPNLYGAVEYFGADYANRKQAKSVLYHFYNAPEGRTLGPTPPHRNLGNLVGILEFKSRGPAGFETEWIQSDAFALAQTMIKEAEKDLGMSIKLPGKFTDQGMLMAQILTRVRGQKGITDLYVKHNESNVVEYYSPNYIKEQQAYWKNTAKALEDGHSPATIQKYKGLFNALLKKIPKETWSDPRLDQMFALPRNHYRDEVQGATLRAGQEADEGRLHSAITGQYNAPDVFASTAEVKQRFSQAQNARETGMAYRDSAPRSMLSYEVRRTYEKLTGVGESAEARKELVSTLHEQDRIGWFTKIFWGLQQLVLRNEHIPKLRDYLYHAEEMNQVAMKWLQRADETARAWDKATPERRAALNAVMFDLSDMRYRTAAEVAAKVARLPTGWQQFMATGQVTPKSELETLFKNAGVKPEDYATIQRVQGDFVAFVNESAQVESARLQRKLANSPQQLQTALAELQKQTAELLGKPFFPHMRFGQFHLTVRDQFNNRKVVEMRVYETPAQRDAAIGDVRRANPGLEITYGKVHASATEFMGLPPYMLKAIKEQLLDKTGKTAQQIKLIDEQLQWIEQFEYLHSPDRTFRRTWAPAHGVPGYSTDAFRAYSNFFMHGARYLSRLAVKDHMEDDIAAVNATVISGDIGNTAKRQMIVKYMQDHFRYIMEGGRDSGKFRAIATQFFLGWSPAAAAMNLTQVPMVLVPWLGGNFGTVQAYGALSTVLTALKANAGIAVGNQAFNKAREEMISQGRINTGQAAEVAAFAEGINLIKMLSGTSAEKLWQNLNYYGMKMFEVTERFNREVSFAASWKLAMQNPNAERLGQIDAYYPQELADLRSRVGLSHQEAVAFLFARESIDRSQFLYAKYTDPPFMRGPYKKNLLIFLKFTQSMLYAYRFNKSMFHMTMLFAFVYGLSGIPFAEDANELIRLLAAKLFGKDVDMLQEARALVRHVTRGTVLDEKGPDLALHGISRYGFGLLALPQSWGAPRFDASMNGSMGKVIPGLADAMHGIALGKDKDMLADLAQRTAGAGYGYIFSLLHYLQEPPGTMDSKKWETLLPRALQGWAKAYRYAPPEVMPSWTQHPFGSSFESKGAATNSAGARVVQFDARDPHDLWSIVTQAAGFTPTKVSERFELQREINDAEAVFKARKTMLYVQMNKALLERSPEAVASVSRAIDDYNDAVTKIGGTGEYIKKAQLINSLKQRNSKVQMMEQLGISNKGQFGVSRAMGDLYPGVKIERVK